ncbi:hypothetical protein [Hyphomicrobium sp. DY-1]|uniref:hypothetical protein n=1 Tax=Hyphomicrobium sp. DY-1 TaxID=3075650 RepID=UPI0039C06654
MSFDGKALGEEIVKAVRSHVEKKLGPVLERLDRADQRFDRLDNRIDAIALRGVTNVVDETAIVSRAINAVRPYIDERVQEAVAAIPAITVDDVRPMIESEVAAAVTKLKVEKSASRRVASITINRSGVLIAETDDGEYRNLGPVAEPQSQAHWFDDAITLGVRALPAPSIGQGV